MADRRGYTVGTACEFDRDRHRRVFGPQPCGHMFSEFRGRHEFRGFRSGCLGGGAGLGVGRCVDGTSTVPGDLAADRGTVSAKPGSDLGVGFAAFDPGADLFAFTRGQRVCWHADGLHRSGACVNSGQSCPHHDLTGGDSTSTSGCCSHHLNSPHFAQDRFNSLVCDEALARPPPADTIGPTCTSVSIRSCDEALAGHPERDDRERHHSFNSLACGEALASPPRTSTT